MYSLAIATKNVVAPILEAIGYATFALVMLLGMSIIWYNMGFSLPIVNEVTAFVMTEWAVAIEWASPGNTVKDILMGGEQP